MLSKLDGLFVVYIASNGGVKNILVRQKKEPDFLANRFMKAIGNPSATTIIGFQELSEKSFKNWHHQEIVEILPDGRECFGRPPKIKDDFKVIAKR